MYETTRSSKIYLHNGIVHVIIYESYTLLYEDVMDINIKVNKITNNKKHLKIIDVRGKFDMEEKSKRFLESKIAKSKIIAQALLLGSNTRQEVVDCFVEMNCRKMPVKVFVDYDYAINWLTSL